ncbi:MAG: class I SAM-dependent methyltransferase [Acidobacteriota bacterium]
MLKGQIRRLVFLARRLKLWISGRGSLSASGDFWALQLKGNNDFVYWLALPTVVQWVNLRLTGSAQIWPLSWFLFSIQDKLPVERAVSIGCGVGNLERETARHQGARHIDGIDVSKPALLHARQAALQAGYSDTISYHLEDAAAWLRNAVKSPGYDLIFFHCSLHHIERLEEVLSLCARCLRGGAPGLLYVDEYIGPSRREWQADHLGHANAIFGRIPPQYKRASKVFPPVALDDPTEMIRSSEIEGVLRNHFEVIHYKPYYGNVVMPLVSAIKGTGLQDPAVLKILSEAMDLEDYLIDRGLLDPLYAVFVCRPLSGSQTMVNVDA